MTATDRSAKIAEFDAHIAILERKARSLDEQLNRTMDAIETLKRIREAEAKLAEGDIKVALLEITLQCHEETGVYE